MLQITTSSSIYLHHTYLYLVLVVLLFLPCVIFCNVNLCNEIRTYVCTYPILSILIIKISNSTNHVRTIAELPFWNFAPQITTFQFSMYMLGIDLQFLHLTLHMIGPCQFVYNINNVNNVKYVQIADNAGNLSFINLTMNELIVDWTNITIHNHCIPLNWQQRNAPGSIEREAMKL